jgi:hypothetical protein
MWAWESAATALASRSNRASASGLSAGSCERTLTATCRSSRVSAPAKSLPSHRRQFQPRVGATYSLGSSRKTLLRASYSRFTSRLGNEIAAINAFPGPAQLYYSWTDPNGNHVVDPSEIGSYQFSNGVDPNNPGSQAPVNQIATNLEPPTTDEFIAGVEREILSDLSAELAYTYRSARNLEFVPLVGTSRSSYMYIANATGTVTASNGFVLPFNEPYYGLTTCPAPCSGIVIANRPDYSETYSGVELQIIKRLSHGWMLRAGFAYNDWQQHVGPGAIVDPNNTTVSGGDVGIAAGNASGPVVEAVGNKFGTVYINSKWQFNVSGMVQLRLGIQTSANFFGRQGFPIVYFVQAFTHDIRDAAPLIQIGQVAAYRLFDVFVLDLHVEKVFQIGSTVAIIPVLDCFNAANSHTVLQRDGFVGSYDEGVFTPRGAFNNPVEFLSSRVFRGGVRISF